MLLVRRCPVVVALVWVVAVTGQGTAAEDGRAAFERFVAGLHGNMPVAGTFTINKQQPADHEARKRYEQRFPNANVRYPPERSTIRCRWAFDRTREVCEPLDGTAGTSPSTGYRRFYIGPDGVVEGHTKSQYAMAKPRRVTYCRPANFNFLDGTHERWDALLKDPDVTFERVEGSGGRSIWAHRRTARMAQRVDLAPDGSLASAAGLYDGKQIWSLTVTEYHLSPKGDKRFPKRATTRTVEPESGRLLAAEELVADEVTFPDPGPGADALFALGIPKGVVVGDRQLHQVVLPQSATQATDLLAHPTQHPRKPVMPAGPAASLPDPPAAYVDQSETGEAEQAGWFAWVWVRVCVLAVALLVVVGRRVVSRPAAG